MSEQKPQVDSQDSHEKEDEVLEPEDRDVLVDQPREDGDEDIKRDQPDVDWEDLARSRYDQMLRFKADFENFRRRMDREREEIQGHAAERLLSALIPVFDNLERALGYMPTEGEAKAWRVGLEMTRDGFLEAFSRLGVKPIEAVGTLFDPRFHEAVQRVESKEPEGTVVEELQRGFSWNDRVLRASLVKVSSGE